MKFLKYFHILPLFLLLSCSTNSGKDSNEKTISAINQTNFRQFIRKFKVLSLPLIINTDEIQATSSLKRLNEKDNTFINSEYPNEIWSYGLLPDTSKTYKIIWLAPAEMLVPVLTTFSKKGQRINEQYLGVGGCGSDCCFWCKESIKINQDMTIYSVDSIRSCECDSIGPKENTMKKYIRFMTGKVSGNGKIKMTEIIEQRVN
ncbi:hypothetical protein NF867_05940 [Solitalea sp. MAHUQ-68]|uniref:Lipoprotein n=1 Tax=Solitalea agri TaxID=2953739 RepID=A0A9X2F1K5_9SPHI|nr:hypothetical protein [Solitalea agri]MCO4292400.1 hypothetical protein [Solitalea agri]